MFGVDTSAVIKAKTKAPMSDELTEEQRKVLELVVYNKPEELKSFLDEYKSSHNGKRFDCDFFVNSSPLFNSYTRAIHIAASDERIALCKVLLDNGSRSIDLDLWANGENLRFLETSVNLIFAFKNKELKNLLDERLAKSKLQKKFLSHLMLMGVFFAGLSGIKKTYFESYIGPGAASTQQYSKQIMNSSELQKHFNEFQQREKQNTK